ncbi:MAG: DUF1592 domain-containing protein, partial [Planctomycetales bacterium]
MKLKRNPLVGKLKRAFIATLVIILPTGSVFAEAPEGPNEFTSFARNYCIECHTGEEAEGELALEQLIASQPSDSNALARIVRVLENGRMPPGDATQPTESERRGAVLAIERQLTVHSCEAEPDPGRVTLRRLNRTEYRNTIRDLIGIDFKAASDFPDDDIGYGFDNNGDVLSMPPVLMERYLVAAEQILDRAIVAEPSTKPQMRYFVPDELSRNPKLKSDPGWGWLTNNGELFRMIKIARSGKYALRIWSWGQQAGPDPARLAIKLDNKVLGKFKIPSERGQPIKSEVTVQLDSGRYRLAAEFINDYWNPDAEEKSERDRNLVITAVEVVGPFEAQLEITDAHRKIFFVAPGSTSTTADASKIDPATAKPIKQQAARQILDRFASRAFRRPVSDQELDRLIRLFDSTDEDDSFQNAVKMALAAVLISPHFLFRVEQDHTPTESGGVYRISDYELASRLSYFLWSSMPDDKLLRLAKQNRLHEPDILDAQVERMLKSPKARALVDNFAAQWLQLRRLDAIEPDTEQFPFDEKLRSAMYEEATAAFEYIMREDRSLLELLDADYT